MLLPPMQRLVHFRARFALLTLTHQICIIVCINGGKTQVYAGSRKLVVWLRPPPSAPSLSFKRMAFKNLLKQTSNT